MALPPRPVTPSPDACCGQGCVPCILDLHTEELRLWTNECQLIQQASYRPQDSKQILQVDEYHSFTLIDIQPVAKDTSRYRFEVVPANHNFGLKPCQHLVIRWRTDSKVVTRQYTPVIQLPGYFDIIIKIYTDGEMSQFIRTWQIGQPIEMRGPLGTFIYAPNMVSRLVITVAGTGITPILPLLRQITEDVEEDTVVHLHYSCRSTEHVISKTQLDTFSDYWNINISYYITKEERNANIWRYKDQVHFRRIQADDIKATFISPVTCFFVACGSRHFEKDMINIAQECGILKEKCITF